MEMDLFQCIYYSTLFSIPIVLYIVFKPGRKSPYANKATWYSFLKQFLARSNIKDYQKRTRKQLSLHKDEELESPRLLIKPEQDNDSLLIYGVDESGNSIILRMTLRQQCYAELTVQLRLNNGKVYQLPNEPKALICSTDPQKWAAGGLSITLLEPFTAFRVTFNGLMKCQSSEENAEVEHVKFNLIWKAGTDPVHYPQDYSWNLIADNLARERWRDVDWFELLGKEQSYEQYGALHGTVMISSCFPTGEEFYFKSWRKRFWGKAGCFALNRDLSIFVASNDGTVLNVGVKSTKNACTHAKYGSVRFSDDSLAAIQETDLNLENIGDNHLVPDAFTFHVKAKDRTVKCVLHFNKSTITETYNDETAGWKVVTAEADCAINTKTGRALITFWYPHSGSRTHLPKPFPTEESFCFVRAPEVLNFTSPGSKTLSYTGGKGRSLGLLASISDQDFIVPEGFVVTTQSFRAQQRLKPRLKEAIERLEAIAVGRIAGDLEETCRDTTKLIESEPVCPEIAETILAETRRVQSESSDVNKNVLNDWKWAVRSSGVSEDSEDLSAAGQNATYLGISGEDTLLKAVSACWASLYSFQSVQYRRQYGLRVDSDIAVVVQRMVPSEAAGVLFTCHPTTGDPSRMVITGNFGLGESVVSGHVDPDTVVLKRSWSGKLAIESKQIGQKDCAVLLKENAENIDCTQVVHLEATKKAECCLTDEQILRLGNVGVFLEEFFGGPRDIEWAFCKGDLYLLQSRPITTLNVWTEYELMHEFDAAVFTNDEMSTRANIGEVAPAANSALTIDVLMKQIDRAIVNVGFFGHVTNKYWLMTVNVFCYCSHLVPTKLFYRFMAKEIQLSNRISDITIYGHEVVNERIHRVAMERYGPAQAMPQLKMFIKSFGGALAAFKYVKQAQIACKELNRKSKEAAHKSSSALELFNQLELLCPLYERVGTCHNITSMGISLSEVIALSILCQGSDEITPDHYADIADLLSSCANIVSANVPNELEKMSKTIVATGKHQEFSQVAAKSGRDWLKMNCSEAEKMFDKFIEENGHRSLYELEYAEPSWRMKPELVIEMLQANCKAPAKEKKVKNVNLESTLKQLKTPVRGFSSFMLKFFINLSRKCIACRELTKSELARSTDIFREFMLKLADLMVFDGILPEKNVIFHLTLYEIEQLLKQRDPTLVFKATQRHRRYPKWKKFKFNESSFGVAKPVEESSAKLVNLGDSSFKMSGIPACTGDVIGRACVIKSLEEISQLQTGDILITHATDIGWSPYFPMLSGVVTELGGLISHGAVVAREYGLPCLIGVTDACDYFKTGDQVLLAGNSGKLELLARN